MSMLVGRALKVLLTVKSSRTHGEEIRWSKKLNKFLPGLGFVLRLSAPDTDDTPSCHLDFKILCKIYHSYVYSTDLPMLVLE